MISIIVPTFQRLNLLARCLDSLAVAVTPLPGGSWEVIVSDDGRKVSAKELIAEKYPWARWVQGPGRGPAANRNHGVRHAQGQWLIFIDDDCLAHEDWLREILGATGRSPLPDIIEGKTITPDKKDHPLRRPVENLTGGNFWSCNLAVRRDVFLKLGGFDEDFPEAAGEDMEFAWRIQKNKLSTFFSKDAIVYHPAKILNVTDILKEPFKIRWTLLYRHKTGQKVTLLGIVAERIWDLFHSTWRFFKKFDASQWRGQLFSLILRWIFFPFVVPYLLWWHICHSKNSNSSVIESLSGHCQKH
jgi:GT2 family glycosyltransferase